jgi:teichuronic acid biosynthesis glycosyltransferase TuaH
MQSLKDPKTSVQNSRMLSQEQFQSLPIFISSMSRWDGEISSASLALAKVLSRTNQVFYIDYPYSWADIWRERNLKTVKRRMPALLYRKDFLVPVTGQSANLLGATPAPVIPNYSLPDGLIHNLAAQYNNGQLAGLVKKVLKQKGISDYIFINSFNPSYLASVDKYLDPALSIYHSRDAIEEVYRNGLQKENECVRHYDMAMATSKRLCTAIGERNDREIAYFPNGGDIKLFKTAFTQDLEKPAELAHIKTPIIGYTGAICQRIDYELLIKIARRHHDKTIVLVGPRQDKDFCATNLDEIPNIIFTGPKKIDQLPAYLKHFDCAIIPFLKNNLTAGIYPLKINEYLGAGRSVVTTNFSEDIAGFGDYIGIADDHEQFLQMIDKAIAENSQSQKLARMQAAQGNSWENRAELFWDLAWNAYQRKIS